MNNFDKYIHFKEQREKLGKMLMVSSDVIKYLNMSNYSDSLSSLSEKVNNDTFKIQVVGTFKNGKSTFINALLGSHVLPAYSLPCTAVINEVKYGEEKKAVLYFKNPLPEQISQSLPADVKSHMAKYAGQNIPPIEIDYNKIEDYVVIPIGKNATESILESPYEKVELFWPLSILKEGVEIIDSPGLNEHSTRTKVTMDYLSKADAILFVLLSTAICAANEMDFIENNLKEQGFNEPFFIVNKWDLVPKEEKNQMIEYVKMKLSGFSTNPIFYVSASKAENAKSLGDEHLYAQSGMKDFEDTLSDYLTKQKGKAKLAQPARELRRILTEEALYKVIPAQRNMLDNSLQELTTKYNNSKPQLDILRKKKDQLVADMSLKIEQSKSGFRRLVLTNSQKLANLIPGWVEEYTPTTELGFIPRREKVEKLISEITDHVQAKVEEYQKQWKNDVLFPSVEYCAKQIFESQEGQLNDLFQSIDHFKTDVSGVDCSTQQIPAWERVAGALVGTFVGGVGLGASGCITGLSKDLAKTAAFEFGALALLGILNLLNPVTLIAVIAGTIFLGWKSGSDKVIQNAKKQIADAMVSQICSPANMQADQLSDSITTKLHEVKTMMATAVDKEIESAEEQVKLIIKDMKNGQAEIDKRKSIIDKCEQKIQSLDIALNELIIGLVN